MTSLRAPSVKRSSGCAIMNPKSSGSTLKTKDATKDKNVAKQSPNRLNLKNLIEFSSHILSKVELKTNLNSP